MSFFTRTCELLGAAYVLATDIYKASNTTPVKAEEIKIDDWQVLDAPSPQRIPIYHPNSQNEKKGGKRIFYTREKNTYKVTGNTYPVKEQLKEIPGHMYFAKETYWRVPANDTSYKMLEDIIASQ